MGRKALLTVVCWLAIGAQGNKHAVNKSIVNDNESAESAPHFHHDSYRIYATGAPYSSYSVRVAEPVKSGSEFIPVKEENLVIHKQNGFLKDSYGNKFVESPQRVAYTTTFPQQYVRLQDLPVHLAQPLAGAPGFHFSGSAPAHLSFGSPIHVNSHRYTPTHSQVYAANAKSQALTQSRFSAPKHYGSSQQQPSTTNNYYGNNQGRTQAIQPRPFQRYEEKPFHGFARADNNLQATQDKANLQKTSQTEQITVTENGKTRTIILDTKPVVPLLNLNLLQPLTFENPVVSQIQHFLPKITYKLPEIESHKHEDEFVVQKTKQYDTGVIYGKPKDEELDDEDEDSSEDEEQDDDSGPSPPPPPKQEQKPPQQQSHNNKPSITVNGNRGDPHYSYEINSPTYKETYNEKVVNYGDKGKGKPVHYSYDMKFEKKPISYSYTSSSKAPVVNKQVQYEVHGQGPKKLVYSNQHVQKATPPTASHPPRQEPSRQEPPRQEPPPQHESEESGESESDESDEDDNSYHSGEEAPNSSHQLVPEHRHAEYRHNHNPQHSHNPQHNHNVHNAPYGFTHGPPPPHPTHFSQPIRVAPTPTFQPQIHNVQTVTPQSYEEDITILPVQHNAQINAGHHQHQQHPNAPVVYHNGNQQNVNQHGHHQNAYHQNGNHQSFNNQHHQDGNTPHENNGNHHGIHHSNQQPGSHHNGNNHQHHNEHPHQVHYHQSDGPVHHHPHPTPTFQPSQPQRLPPHPSPRPPPPQHPRPDPTPHVVEKFRKVIIQEESPEEMEHHEDIKEEDFEKSYKNAAYGFPAYDRNDDDVEKDIYNSEGYGVPKYHSEDAEDFEKSPFAQYQEDGDSFPKSARLSYRGDRDDLKEDYFLDYSVSKPESITDRFKNKANYYKMFKKQKPKHYYGSEPKKSAKYTSAPTSFIEKDGPKFEYDYSKEAPRDSFSGVESRRNGKTLFVEPQFQYGFEPSSLPYLLDSELSAMATNHHPKSEKPAMRKKIYKENWYIKTSKSGSNPAS